MMTEQLQFGAAEIAAIQMPFDKGLLSVAKPRSAKGKQSLR